jgi:hypothetical protein
MITKIISPGGAREIIEWLGFDPGKFTRPRDNRWESIGYQDYDLSLSLDHKDGSAKSGRLTLSKPATFFGSNRQHKKVFLLFSKLIGEKLPREKTSFRGSMGRFLELWCEPEFTWTSGTSLKYRSGEVKAHNTPLRGSPNDSITFEYRATDRVSPSRDWSG